MTRINRISCVRQADGSTDIVVPAGMETLFQEMVSRATRSWQDQHPEIRDFADRLLKRDHIMGSNMKEGLSAQDEYLPMGGPYAIHGVVLDSAGNDKTLAKRSCCGTLLREPHHTQCPERLKDGGSIYNAPFKFR